MTKKAAPIRIFYFKTKHKGKDAWKVVIDDPGAGPLTELRTRYTRPGSARRGGWRKIQHRIVGDARFEFVNGKPITR